MIHSSCCCSRLPGYNAIYVNPPPPAKTSAGLTSVESIAFYYKRSFLKMQGSHEIFSKKPNGRPRSRPFGILPETIPSRSPFGKILLQIKRFSLFTGMEPQSSDAVFIAVFDHGV